jgi:hypothetical protein
MGQMDSLADVAQRYGVDVTNQWEPAELNALRDRVDFSTTVYWTSKQLKRIVRFRIVGYNYWEYPWWDFSYCYGELHHYHGSTRCADKSCKQEGPLVQVDGPFDRLPQNWKGEMYKRAVKDNVYAKGLGIFEEDVYSTLAG